MSEKSDHTALSAECATIEQAAMDALSWLDANAELVGTGFDGLHRSLKLQAIEARRLARACQRPVSVGLFGPSQHGKSFLGAAFLRGVVDHKDVSADVGRVRFGSGDESVSMDFLTEVNPQGLKETTGLVTRFTRSDVDSPVGYPIRLRLLAEIDLVKIMANSFVYDLGMDPVVPLTAESVSLTLERLGAQAASEPVDQLRAEDIYELEDYFEHWLARHPLSGDAGVQFWSQAFRLLPRLNAQGRTEAYALLWGGVQEFTDVFLELKRALDELGHPEYAFAKVDAISPNTPGKTVLHVLTMKEGLRGGGDVTALATLDGKVASLRKPVITAIAFELTVQLQSVPWRFLASGDLLDFPGARSRDEKRRDAYFNNPAESHPVGEAFLRGKVEVMFQKYISDFDLNLLVACHIAQQGEVSQFKNLLEQWIARSHGRTPEMRQHAQHLCLYLAATFCDRLFDVSVGQADTKMKLDNALGFIGQLSSIAEWTPNQPFTNSFLIRNPSGKRLDDLFETETVGDGWIEIDQRADKAPVFAQYSEAFSATDVAMKFFENPAEKWGAMTRANDGGVALLAATLEHGFDSSIKFHQIAPRVKVIRDAIVSGLRPYFESGDIEARVAERTAAIDEVIAVLRKRIDLLPRFIAELQPSREQIEQVYLAQKRQDRVSRTEPDEMLQSVGEATLASWAARLARLQDDDEVLASYGLDEARFRCVASELDAAGRLASLAQAIDAQVAEIENYSKVIDRNAGFVGASLITLLGDFVSYLGMKGRFKYPATPDKPFFDQKASLSAAGVPDFPENREAMAPIRDAYKHDWLEALRFVTRSNAGSSAGALVDVEQNARLGRVLSALGEDAS